MSSPDQPICQFCATFGHERPAAGWVELRLYNGPGEKIGELEVNICAAHLAAMRPAYERELVECRVTRLEPEVRS